MVPAGCRLPKEPGQTAIQMHQEKTRYKWST